MAETHTDTRGLLGLHPTVFLLASVHMLVDGYTNIYAPLLPMLIPRLSLSLTLAGTLAMCFQMAASVTQLGFGYIADRWHPRLLLTAGPLLCVVVLSFTGVAPSVFLLSVVLIIGGLGSAAFHPPAAALAYQLGGRQPGFVMSVYITGGTLGFAIGPLLFAPVAERFGLEWTPLLVLPGLAVIIPFLRRVPDVPLHAEQGTIGLSGLRPYAKPLGLLYAIVVLRQLTALGISTFVPVMLTRQGMSVSQAAVAIATYLLAGGLGGFIGGPASDRFGARRVIILSMLLSVPFLAVAPLLDGWMFTAVLAVGGLFLQLTLPVTVVFGQTVAPVSAATVSSIMMGFAWGTAGLSVPFVGMLADLVGIGHTLIVLAFVPLLAALCAMPLPSGTQPHATLPPVAAAVASNLE